jgi:hypothetical protein
MTFVLRFCIVKESYFATRYFIFSFSKKTIFVKRKDKVLIFDFLHRTLQRNLKLCFRIPHKHSKITILCDISFLYLTPNYNCRGT